MANQPIDKEIRLHTVATGARRKPTSPRVRASKPQSPAQVNGISHQESAVLPEGLPSAGASDTAPDEISSVTEALDHSAHAALARFTHGLSPAALMGAYFDWFTHITTAPGKQMRLAEKATDKAQRFASHAIACATSTIESKPCIEPLEQDHRFDDSAWQQMPFNMLYQGFLLNQQWWHNAVTGVPGVTRQHERELQFLTRQILDVFSPSNFLFSNPKVLKKTRNEGGQNLVRGFRRMVEDSQRVLANAPPAGAEDFQPGRDVAVSPGKVVYRNTLIELIQYAPTTGTVRPEPVLMVPAWIMKYYILDLSPENSLMRYLVAQGYTVFMISWKNPTAEDRDLTMEDYRKLGVLAAIEAINAIVPDQKIHAAGYCLGGTLLSIAAAALARMDGDPFASMTLLASQVDFTEPGELQLFINESQLAFLDSVMWKQGYLDTGEMAGAFQMLRSNDLIWSRMTREYLEGETRPMSDLMAWNADGTRMPYAMHSEYLHRLYLNNDLAGGRFDIDDRPVAISDIRVPIFAVGTLEDHVAPWQSVFKIERIADTQVTFVLTSSGHNAGIVSEPGHPRRSFRIRTHEASDLHMDSKTWMDSTHANDGSWWEAWVAWLDERSRPAVTTPPMGNAKAGYAVLADAPGAYVMAK